jgi:hypothetical protein
MNGAFSCFVLFEIKYKEIKDFTLKQRKFKREKSCLKKVSFEIRRHKARIPNFMFDQ